jgi:hypothetical protein
MEHPTETSSVQNLTENIIVVSPKKDLSAKGKPPHKSNSRKSHREEKGEVQDKLKPEHSEKHKRRSHRKQEDKEPEEGKHSPRKDDSSKSSRDHSPERSHREIQQVDYVEYNKPIDKTAKVTEPWILDQFTDEQKIKITQFKEGPASEFITAADNDLQIARWLVARKWDINEASKMFTESKKWRQAEKIDTIFEWIPTIKSFKFLSTYWPISILPEQRAPRLRTYDGYLVVYERLTEMHPDILDIVSVDDMVKFHLYIQELCAREIRRICAEEKPGTYGGVVYVYDLVSLTLSHLTRSNYNLFEKYNVYDANNYPETVRRVYLINSPSVFTVGWKVAKKFLDPVTIKKILILGSDYQAELSKVIPPECIPKSLGGTLDYTITGGGSIKGIKKFY